MPQIYDMGPTALLPLRRKAYRGFFRPKNSTASAGFERTNLGTKASTLPLDHRSRSVYCTTEEMILGFLRLSVILSSFPYFRKRNPTNAFSDYISLTQRMYPCNKDKTTESMHICRNFPSLRSKRVAMKKPTTKKCRVINSLQLNVLKISKSPKLSSKILSRDVLFISSSDAQEYRHFVLAS